MAKLYLICGLVGSGKTTYSKQLEKEQNALRLSLDEWMIPLYGEHMERQMFEKRRSALQSLFNDSACRLLDLGVPVIFDYGFWKKIDREKTIKWAETMGHESVIYFIDTPSEVRRLRIARRNLLHSSQHYFFSENIVELFDSWFEAPSFEENPITITSEPNITE